MIALLTIFSIVVMSLIWARIYFFKVQSRGSRLISLINDPAVLIQMAGFYYCLFNSETFYLDWRIAFSLYVAGLIIFYWAIKTAKILSFANSESIGGLITSGPYSIVRHPCYLSYMLFWLGNCLLFAVPLIWISFIALVCVYGYSARNEERYILRSHLGYEYAKYKNTVGMFLPKIF